MTWRDQSKRVIQDVLKAHPNASPVELKKLLRDAYPFGPRENHPYRVWCDEVRKTLNRLNKPMPLFEQ